MQILACKGDTLSLYSERFDLPHALLVDSNPHVTHDVLQEGEEIYLPGYEAHVYKVKKGDTRETIVRELDTPVDALTSIIRSPLTAGEEIVVPVRVKKAVINGQKNYDFTALMNDLQTLLKLYPFLRMYEIGKSVLGKPLVEIQIGRGSKHVHMNGSFHANEWITTAVIMTFLNDYLCALTNGKKLKGANVRSIYERVTLSIVPMVNPDGVDLVLNGPPPMEPYRSDVVSMNGGSNDFSQWKANIRGIDLNNQFPAKWEVEKERKIPKEPAPRDFPGFSPLSEPETVAMAQLTKERDFVKVLAFHTQGKEIYWGYEQLEPKEAEKEVNEFARQSGYAPVRYIDSHAGYRDWFIQEWKRRGYTIELGEGVNPLPLEQFPDIYEDSLGIFLTALQME
ncbi:gamma-D-glutamyl-{L}-meso-diaminopimelate peptidase I [Thermolongibacillus altinsuensis]|uniref:Gamma-D-glutamyl-(L)-meso-diaminopimelate peptidase I n=1 Tax=Thermolongibacillus altinsuensis TaxID=575256 RepID=A0A4R1QCX3_9BACL|nr:M14 family metallopeptidase [Thermolongibacillus altinsuensis]TCL48808.1 gamma-D-glutamyl-{L}-meso-diaminopimelate peptidase I [Thermolongibacillus altinsuensis]